jgi:hypothetical protein
MSDVKLNDAQERSALLALFPDYVLAPGTELCLVPHLKRYAEALAEEGEEEIMMDLGINDEAAHPQYSEGFDDGLRHAAKVLKRLLGADE